MGDEKIRRRSRKRRSLGFLLASSQRRETSILAVLRDDPKFRWAFSLLILAGLALGIMLPKIWITTDDGIVPVVKVSGLDLLQTRSLMRTARKQEEAGKMAEAIQAWTSAIANNPGEVAAVRGLLETLGRDEKLERRWVGMGVGQAYWLLQLTHTNQADLELAGKFFERAELHDLSIRLLGEPQHPRTPSTSRSLAIAYFETSQMDQFATHWEKHGAGLETDPQLRLYHAAWASVWGPPSGMKEGLRILTEATKDRAHQTLALQLLLNVQSQRLDPDGFNATFVELQALRADRIQDHIRYWMLLNYLGQRALAVEKARAYAVPPQTVTEADLLLKVWNLLGMHDLAVDFARQQMPSFPGAPQLWLMIGRMLTTAQRWDDLRSVAVEMRNNPRLARVFGGYTFFLEGVAEHGAGKRERAEEAFRQMLGSMPEETLMAFECGTTLQRLGYNESAQAIYKRLESILGGKVEFWQKMAQSAHETQNADLLATACEKAYQLAPTNPVAINNYAAVLLMTRRNAAEAIRLTVDVVSRSPDSRIAVVNHALALAQNGQFTEARRRLDGLNPLNLSTEERTFWHMGQLESALGQNDLDRARSHIDQVEQRFLFPPQADWLTQARAKLVKKAG